MNKVLKIILIALIALVVIVGIFVTVVLSNLDKIVKEVVERTGTQATGTTVQVEKVDVSLRNLSAGLSGLTIANPEGFNTENAFALTGISVDIGEVTRDEIVINSIIVDGAQVTLEQNAAVNNLKTILDHVRAFAGPADETQPAEEQPTAEGPKLVIREFRFTNAQASLHASQLDQPYSASLPDIVLNDIGEKGKGVTAAEATRQILDPLIEKALEAAQKEMMEKAKERAGSEILKKLPFGKKDG